MGQKPKFDLENVGGRPKDRLDQDRSDATWLSDMRMSSVIVLAVGALIVCLGAFAYSLL